MSEKDGFDSKKRWGNSATRGYGVNSPAMMDARKGFAKSSALKKKTGGSSTYKNYSKRSSHELPNNPMLREKSHLKHDYY